VTAEDARDEFLRASVWHGTLERCEAILAAHPEIADADVHVAAVLGDAAAVSRFIARDPTAATSRGGPRGWDPLTYLCFSKYLRLDPSRSHWFVRAARALLEAGASARTGVWEADHEPEPEWESVMYGAAGVAHHPELTRLLLEYGADPNDEETPYHAPETYDNRALEVLVRSGRLTDESLTMILLRKTDWHDADGVRWLLDRGIDPNRMSRFGKTALHNALLSDNALPIIETLLEHGANPLLALACDERIRTGAAGQTAVSVAARRGRGDVLDLFERRGLALALDGVERLIAACARDDDERVRSIAAGEPRLVDEIVGEGGTLLAQFAGNGNTEGVRHLLDLGVDVNARYVQGNSYLGIAPNSTALHVAAWLARHGTVVLLVERGAAIEMADGKGRTPLTLAVRACVDSYWTRRRSAESVAALLKAGASVDGVMFPSGYPEVDELLAARGAESGSK
jgi:ankyrin repeat protein